MRRYLKPRMTQIPCYLDQQISPIARNPELRISRNSFISHYFEPRISRIPHYLEPRLSRISCYLEPRISRIPHHLEPRIPRGRHYLEPRYPESPIISDPGFLDPPPNYLEPPVSRIPRYLKLELVSSRRCFHFTTGYRDRTLVTLKNSWFPCCLFEITRVFFDTLFLTLKSVKNFLHF